MQKVDTIQADIRVEPGAYKGARKVSDVLIVNFVLESNVKECVESIKIKNCEGYDHIPQRVLVYGSPHLLVFS